MNRRHFLKTTATAAAAAGLTPAFVREVGASTPVKVGVMLPLSKVMASLGESTLSGVQFGHKELGAEVAGRPIQLIQEDDAADPSLGLSKVRKLVEKDGVDVVVATVSSGVAAAIRNYIVDAKRLWLNPISVNDTLAEKDCTKYHFRFSASAWQIANPLGPWGKAKFGARAYVLASNYAYGQQTGAHFKKSFADAGGTIVGEAYPPLNTTNYAPYFQPLRDARPDFAFVNLLGTDAVAFMKQYAEFGLKNIKVVGPVSLVSEDVLYAQGDSAVGVFSISYYSPTYDIPRNRWFSKAYKEFARGKEPDHFNSAGFDVMQALYGALRSTKGETANKDRLIEWIAGARIDSPRGPLRFDPKNHNPIQDMHIRVVEANPLRSVVTDTIKDLAHPNVGCNLA
jgi:branched-chain amino acid transport system substrate-binding protein